MRLGYAAVAAKSQTIVSLDIGTSNVKAVISDVVLEKGEPVINIIGVGSAPSKGLRKGVVINIEATVNSIASAVQMAETMAGRKVSSVYIAMSGEHIQSLNSDGTVRIRSGEVSKHDIVKVMDDASAVAIPADKAPLHVIPREFIVDDQKGIKDPLGMSGVRLEARVHIILGAVSSSRNIIKCANKCGLNVAGIVLAPIASAQAVITPEEKELGVCMIDIGGGTVDLSIFHAGGIRHSCVFSFGGSYFTNDIAAVLMTPIASAEEIKCRYVNLLEQGEGVGQGIDVPSTGGRPSRIVKSGYLTEIVKPRVVESCGFVREELLRPEFADRLAGGIVITGGSANMRGIAEVAESVFGLPVRIGRVTGVGGMGDMVVAPEYAAVVGAIKYGAQNLTSAPTSQIGKVTSLAKSFGSWVSKHF